MAAATVLAIAGVAGKTVVYNTRDLLIAMALLGIGLTWPILLIIIAPLLVACILARVGLGSPTARALCILASLYPLVWLALIYLMWTIAWRVVGHHPSPGNDDPTHISPFVNAVHGVAAVMFFGLPISFLLGLGLVSHELIVDKRSSSVKPPLTTGGAVFLGIWVTFAIWCVADPGEAIEWFFD